MIATNSDVDLCILDCIGLGAFKASQIMNALPDKLVQKNDKMRTVDRGLQRLRRSGQIKFKNGRWQKIIAPTGPEDEIKDPQTRKHYDNESTSILHPVFE